MKIHKLETNQCYFSVFENASKDTQFLIINPIEHWNSKKELDTTFGAQNIKDVTSLPAYLHSEALQAHWDMPDMTVTDLTEELEKLGFVHNADLSAYAMKDEVLSDLDNPEPVFDASEDVEEHSCDDECDHDEEESDDTHAPDCACCAPPVILEKSSKDLPEGMFNPSDCYFAIFEDKDGSFYSQNTKVLYITPQSEFDMTGCLNDELGAHSFEKSDVPDFVSAMELMESTWDISNLDSREVMKQMGKCGFIYNPKIASIN